MQNSYCDHRNFDSVNLLLNKLSYLVSELPKKDISNVGSSVGSIISCYGLCLKYLKERIFLIHKPLSCIFSSISAKPGIYRASVPLILSEDEKNAYRVVELEGELLSAEINFEPKTLDFKVVPLAIENSVEFEIIAKGYRK